MEIFIKKYLFYACLLSIFFCYACEESTIYTLQFQNKTAFQLDSIRISLGKDRTFFALKAKETSKEILFEKTGREVVNGFLLSCWVMQYATKDNVFKYNFAQTLDFEDFKENQTNQVTIDTLTQNQQLRFIFKLIK